MGPDRFNESFSRVQHQYDMQDDSYLYKKDDEDDSQTEDDIPGLDDEVDSEEDESQD